jgi:hypothetical protein
MCCASRSGRPGEGDIVVDDGVRTDRNPSPIAALPDNFLTNGLFGREAMAAVRKLCLGSY